MRRGTTDNARTTVKRCKSTFISILVALLIQYSKITWTISLPVYVQEYLNIPIYQMYLDVVVIWYLLEWKEKNMYYIPYMELGFFTPRENIKITLFAYTKSEIQFFTSFDYARRNFTPGDPSLSYLLFHFCILLFLYPEKCTIYHLIIHLKLFHHIGCSENILKYLLTIIQINVLNQFFLNYFIKFLIWLRFSLYSFHSNYLSKLYHMCTCGQKTKHLILGYCYSRIYN